MYQDVKTDILLKIAWHTEEEGVKCKLFQFQLEMIKLHVYVRWWAGLSTSNFVGEISPEVQNQYEICKLFTFQLLKHILVARQTLNLAKHEEIAWNWIDNDHQQTYGRLFRAESVRDISSNEASLSTIYFAQKDNLEVDLVRHSWSTVQ